ncbi:MAG: hypothetical protein ACE5GA_09165 [Candidatus Zixiibacteriota bacterium]
MKVDSRGTEIAAFDFTFAYDRAAFEILDALPGTFPDSCDWEYFTVRHSPACSGPCPSGLIKIVALSEYADSRGQACHLPEEGASLIKFVIRPRTPESMDFLDLSLRFFWIDCGDNSVASVSGNELFLAAATLEPDSIPLPVYGDQGFPNYTGPPSDCFRGRAENAPFAKLNLRNGLLRYTPSESAPVAPSDSSSDAPVDSSR